MSVSKIIGKGNNSFLHISRSTLVEASRFVLLLSGVRLQPRSSLPQKTTAPSQHHHVRFAASSQHHMARFTASLQHHRAHFTASLQHHYSTIAAANNRIFIYQSNTLPKLKQRIRASEPTHLLTWLRVSCFYLLRRCASAQVPSLQGIFTLQKQERA